MLSLHHSYRRALTALAALIVLSPLAMAHTGHIHGALSFSSGFAHPWLGLDHLLAMVCVGLWAVVRRERIWVLPAAFMGGMALGGALGAAHVPLPGTELAIAASVVLAGVAVAAASRMPIAPAAALVALFGLTHGHAHGLEMAQGASYLTYSAGFLLATAMLHGLGLGAALGFEKLRWAPAARWTGGAVAAAGVLMMAGLL